MRVSFCIVCNNYYHQIAEIKRCLKAHLIKSSEELLGDLMQNGVYTPSKEEILELPNLPDH
ncbi:MAG: hypothetical protein II209_03780 [Alistipes sp.]|nr:hypothetical protein [Alistipes sp.]MBQ5861818.1 hypothetical protein [Alistipes sp.]